MKKIIITVAFISFFCTLFSQTSDKKENKLTFNIIRTKEKNSSDVDINYVFSQKFYVLIKKQYHFLIRVKNKKTGESLVVYPKTTRGTITIHGLEPNTPFSVRAYMNDSLLFDSLLRTNNIRTIYIRNRKNISFKRKVDFSKNKNIYIVIGGTLLDGDGNFAGSYTEKGTFKKNIKKKGNGDWFKNNGILGVLEEGRPFLFSGLDPILSPNSIDYYNSGLAIDNRNKVFLKDYRGIYPVSWFIQNGPIIIKDGKNKCGLLIDKSKKIRSAIGFDGNDMYYFLSSEMTYIEFADYLIKMGIDKALSLSQDYYMDKYGIYGEKNKNKNDLKIILFK